MGDVASAYAVLGLGPGADRKAVENAYRRLMRRHHPDRAGGDPARAAAINDAYALLRYREADTALPFRLRKRRAQRRRALWLPVVVVGLVPAATLWLLPHGVGLVTPSHGPPGGGAHAVAPQPPGRPNGVDDEAISAAVEQALAYAQGQKWKDAERYAATCASDLARLGGPSLLDHCVAFERAVALVQGREPDRLPGYSAVAEALMGTHVLGQARIRTAARRAEDQLVRSGR